MKQVKDKSTPDEETAAGEGYRHLPFQKDKDPGKIQPCRMATRAKLKLRSWAEGCLGHPSVEKIMNHDPK